MSEAAFADFAVVLHPHLVRVLTLHCGDVHVAEELAHDALLRVREKWSRVQHAADPQAYAIRIGINLANSRFRRRAAERRALQRVAEQPRSTATMAEDVVAGEQVRVAMAALPPRQREAVVRRYYLDQSIREVAAAMGITEGAVGSACNRGLASLRQVFDFSIDEQEVRP